MCPVKLGFLKDRAGPIGLELTMGGSISYEGEKMWVTFDKTKTAAHLELSRQSGIAKPFICWIFFC